MSPDLRLTVGEDLLPMSVQKSPNLCVFSVWFLTSFHNGLPRSIGHGRRRLTNRQAFSLGVIDLFSVCVEEHLTDCGTVAIHILEEPLLGEPLPGRGLCEGLNISLREEVVLGLMACWRRTRQFTASPWRSSTGDLTTTGCPDLSDTDDDD